LNLPDHIKAFIDNRNEVKRLVDIHVKVVGTNVGRKADVEILHKSAIVLLTACWESYVESTVCSAFEYLLSRSNDPNVFPKSVLIKAVKEIRFDKDERRIWDLAGTGWKKILTNYKNEVLSKEIEYFHVPRAGNVDELFERIIGLEKISKKWTWKGQNNSDTIKTLDKFIDLRGAIAHKIKVDQKIQKKDILYFLNFINNLTVATNNAV
jgi:hypothetical protein